MAMVAALYDPTELGIKDKMAAAKDLLDRAGLGKVDKVDVRLRVVVSSIYHLKKVRTNNLDTTLDRDLGFWELPKPAKGAEKEWHPIVRVAARVVPFGYKIDPDNDKLLSPIPKS